MNALRSNASVLTISLLLLAGCGKESRMELAGVSFVPQTGWEIQETASSMRAAQFRLPGDGSIDDAQFVIYYFGPKGGGSVEDNIDRWSGQFEQPDGRASREAAATAKRIVHGLAVTTVDLPGTYVAETFPGSGERVNQPEYRLLAAIISTDAGPYYAKLVDPAQTVARWQASHDAFIRSLRPQAADTDQASTPHP